MQIKQVSLFLLSILFIGIAILSIVTERASLISFIVAYITSSIIVLASFQNYKNMVLKRLETMESANEIEDRDTIDQLEDPYGLYDEEEPITDIKELKEQLKQERRSKKDVAKDTLSAFTPLRIVAYAIMAGGFFYLLKSGNLDLKYYVTTLIIPNLTSVIYLVFFTKN